MIYDVISYIWKFIRIYQLRLGICLLFLLGITVTTLIEPYIYKLIIDLLTESFSDNSNTISRVIFYLGIWGITSFVGLVLFAFYRYKIDMIFLSVYRDFIMYAFDKIVGFDVQRHLDKKSGEIIKKLDNASESLFWIPFDFCISFLPSFLSFIGIVSFSLFIHWQMTLISMSLMPIYVIIFVVGGFKTSHKQTQAVEKYNKAIGRAYDTVANIQIVKSFAQEKQEFTLFNRLVHEATVFQKKVSFFWSMLSTGEFFLQIITRFVIFAGGIYFIHTGSLTVGTMIMFLAFSNYIYAPLQVLGNQIQGIQKHAINIQKVRKLIEKIPEIRDMPYAKVLKITKGSITFDHISFAYTLKRPLLKNIFFTIPSGKITAIVGRSGAGKSTIISLLNRFYDIKQGNILIDGQSVKEVTQESLRKNIGMVMQENSMFNDTIFNNIHYGNLKASKKQVIEASKKANIHDFIMSLPDKYETKVGERGLKLSGGEKQRVAIARVILKNPPILVLDEATSSLDSETEKIIQQALEVVMKGRTTIIIAHRLSTVRKADQIIVLDQGEIKEVGSHQQLMGKNGIYRKLVDLQVAGFLAE